MPLTDVAIRNAKPREKPYKVGDTLGLFLLVQPSGGKLWRVKYRIDGKEKKLAIGIYPQVGLAEARRRRDAARELVAAGKDPGREKQREKVRSRIQAETTFDAIAAEFCQKRRRDGQKAWAVSTATRSEYLLSLLKGSIGKIPITDIEPADVLIAVRKIERKGQLESARRTLQLAGAVFRYAVATARLPSDPTRDLRGALTAPTVTHSTRRAWASCCALLMGMKASQSPSWRCCWLHTCSCDPASYVTQNGANSSSREHCGPSRRARPRCARITLFRSHARPLRYSKTSMP